jgi:hypothetical protein
MRIARTGCLAGLLLSLAAPAAAAAKQVQVDVRLEKARHLAGEPVFVVVDVRNVGDEAIEYEPCDRRVKLDVVGAGRRKPPNIFGCDDMGMGGGGGCGSNHHPFLPPGQRMTSRHLLTDYELKPGRYQLTASGKAGLIGEIAGAPFTTTVSLEVIPASERELQAAFAPLVAAAGTTTAEGWWHARLAIIESAPPFLESLIAQFAADGHDGAVEALGRLATTRSRAHLKALFGTSKVKSKSSIVLALARIGHRDDFEFLATVLEDSKEAETTRGYAALGLGRLGGAAAVRRLERALPTVPSKLRQNVITALGNTGSALAVPILIRLYANDDDQLLVCRGVRILTHRRLCDGSVLEAAAWRRKTLQWWAANGPAVPIYGLDNCPADPAVPAADVDPAPAPVVEQKAPLGPPRVVEVVPPRIAPNTNFTVNGFDMDVEDRKSVHVSFTQGRLVHTAKEGGSGGLDLLGGDGRYVEFVAPAELSEGKWQLVIDADGRRSAPFDVEIIRAPDVELVAIFPSTAHPAQGVDIDTKNPPPVDVYAQLTDARGRQWRIEPGVSRTGISLGLPEDVAEGEASIRVARIDNGSERWSAPITFAVTSGPLPLSESAVTEMIPVAPGQWSDLVLGDADEWEVKRVDRVDVEFRQGDVTVVSPASLPANTHVRVPPRLKPGVVTVRTRTWIEQTASAWSLPATFTLLERPVPPTITSIFRASGRHLWSWDQSADSAKGFIEVRAGQSLRVYGHFPVADRRDLYFRLRSSRAMLNLPMRIEDSEILIHIPSQLPPQTAPEDWMLVVGTRARRAPTRDVTAVRIR